MKLSDMVGRVFTSVTVTDQAELKFCGQDGIDWIFYHAQDCCEDVYIESITGDLSDLENTPLTLVEESSSRDQSSARESATWTFYKFASIKGYVDVRWLGSSNGYYSESVDLKINDRTDGLKKIVGKLDLI